MTPAALGDLRVLDLTRLLPGGLCTSSASFRGLNRNKRPAPVLGADTDEVFAERPGESPPPADAGGAR